MDNIPTKLFVWIYSTGLLLFAVGYFLWLYNFDELYWSMRIVIAFSFLGLIAYGTAFRISNLLLFFFIFFILGAYFALQFDKSPYDTLYMICNCAAIYALIFYLTRYLNYNKMSIVLFILFIVALLVNGYFVFELVKEISSRTINIVHHVLFVIAGTSILLLVFAALFYNHIDNTKKSMNFLVFSILFTFYHIFLTMGHYKIGYSRSASLMTSRVLLILSFVFLSRYLLINRKLERKKPSL